MNFARAHHNRSKFQNKKENRKHQKDMTTAPLHCAHIVRTVPDGRRPQHTLLPCPLLLVDTYMYTFQKTKQVDRTKRVFEYRERYSDRIYTHMANAGKQNPKRTGDGDPPRTYATPSQPVTSLCTGTGTGRPRAATFPSPPLRRQKLCGLQ